GVKRFRLQNRRTRILSADQQRRLLDTCERMPKLQALLKLALITGARIGERLALRWDDCQGGYMTFWQTKNGKVRRIPITEAIAALLAGRPRIHPWVIVHTLRHCTVAHDRARSRRPHGNGDLGALVDTDARAVHASNRRAKARSAGDVRFSGHKLATKTLKPCRTTKRGSRSCLIR
ncbi:MAG: hypothetical protein DMF93_15930, partial [Acidobacteria bacterium]